MVWSSDFRFRFKTDKFALMQKLDHLVLAQKPLRAEMLGLKGWELGKTVEIRKSSKNIARIFQNWPEILESLWKIKPGVESMYSVVGCLLCVYPNTAY